MKLETLMKASVASGPYGDGYGITLRQHFAGLAMQGIMAMQSNMDVMHALVAEASAAGMDSDAYIASSAVSLADALLAELSKESP